MLCNYALFFTSYLWLNKWTGVLRWSLCVVWVGYITSSDTTVAFTSPAEWSRITKAAQTGFLVFHIRFYQDFDSTTFSVPLTSEIRGKSSLHSCPKCLPYDRIGVSLCLQVASLVLHLNCPCWWQNNEYELWMKILCLQASFGSLFVHCHHYFITVQLLF